MRAHVCRDYRLHVYTAKASLWRRLHNVNFHSLAHIKWNRVFVVACAVRKRIHSVVWLPKSVVLSVNDCRASKWVMYTKSSFIMRRAVDKADGEGRRDFQKRELIFMIFKKKRKPKRRKILWKLKLSSWFHVLKVSFKFGSLLKLLFNFIKISLTVDGIFDQF